jgi:hypothetical protein
MRWLFWEVDFGALDTEAHGDYILPRILERGRLEDVRWAIDTYGLVRIHAFFREVGHPELSGRTLAFWRALLQAEDETWQAPSRFRANNSAPWTD